ncbi:MAG: OmpH family outer membrane protein [Candidatus Omnitrophota bacterium]
MKKLFVISLVSIFLVSLLINVSPALAADKIGYVDLSRAFDEYEKTKDFDKSLEKKGNTKQEEREKLVKEIRKMRDELDLLNEKTKEKKGMDVEVKMRSLQEFDQEAKTELVRERDNMVRDILKEMNDVIEEYGKKNNFSIILNDRVLLYGADTLNITNDIIKILNENYKK